MDKIEQNAAQALERIAGMRDEQHIDPTKATRLDERQGILNDRADIRLEMGSTSAITNTGRPPHFYRLKAKGPQQSTRIMDRENRCNQAPLIPDLTDDLCAPGNFDLWNENLLDG